MAPQFVGAARTDAYAFCAEFGLVRQGDGHLNLLVPGIDIARDGVGGTGVRSVAEPVHAVDPTGHQPARTKITK